MILSPNAISQLAMMNDTPQLFKNNIIVKKSSSSSSQATVFYCRETKLNIPVVIKQYKGRLQGIFRELKVFTEIERLKHKMAKEQDQGLLITANPGISQVPLLFSYSIDPNKGVAEMMMTDEGKNLLYWQKRVKPPELREQFVMAMIKQLFSALQMLHSFGYAHGDIKPENICAKPLKDGSFKFTLIDFGVIGRAPKIGEYTQEKVFRGNLLASSSDHLNTKRAGTIDDLYSLLCVAYYFIHETLPWHTKVMELATQKKIVQSQLKNIYIKLRLSSSYEFDEKLISDSGILSVMFEDVCNSRKIRNQHDLISKQTNKILQRTFQVNYNLFKSRFLNKNLKFYKNQIKRENEPQDRRSKSLNHIMASVEDINICDISAELQRSANNKSMEFQNPYLGQCLAKDVLDQIRVKIQAKRGIYNKAMKPTRSVRDSILQAQSSQIVSYTSPSYQLLLQKGRVNDDISALSVSNNGSVMNKSHMSCGMSFLGRQSISKSQFPQLSDQESSREEDSGSQNNLRLFQNQRNLPEEAKRALKQSQEMSQQFSLHFSDSSYNRLGRNLTPESDDYSNRHNKSSLEMNSRHSEQFISRHQDRISQKILLSKSLNHKIDRGRLAEPKSQGKVRCNNLMQIQDKKNNRLIQGEDSKPEDKKNKSMVDAGQSMQDESKVLQRQVAEGSQGKFDLQQASLLVAKFAAKKKPLPFYSMDESVLVAREQDFEDDLNALPVDEMDELDEVDHIEGKIRRFKWAPKNPSTFKCKQQQGHLN